MSEANAASSRVRPMRMGHVSGLSNGIVITLWVLFASGGPCSRAGHLVELDEEDPVRSLHKLSEYLLDCALRQRDKSRVRLGVIRDDQEGLVESVAACSIPRAVVDV